MATAKEMQIGNDGRKSILKERKMLDPESLRELQEKLKKQAQESLELRGGRSIKELIQDARRVRATKP